MLELRPSLPVMGRRCKKTREPARIVGKDQELEQQLALVESAADTDCSILITGESGTGKELVAELVHRLSPRQAGRLVAVNCAAIPEALVEAELFGHVAGAFTGANHARLGRIQSANGGTLFLDEIGDLPLPVQAKLLRVLQDREVYPVGSDTPVEVDVRFVAATNQDLEAQVAAGAFRADLLFRLNVIRVELPPLRSRQGDILLLAQHFITQTNERTGRKVTGLTSEAEAALLTYDWPGNVRELSNIIERAVILRREGPLAPADFHLRALAPAAVPAPRLLPRLAPVPSQPDAEEPPSTQARDLNLRSALDRVERQLINQALERSQGNRTEAAALLGLNRTTLVEKMRKLA